ncbi:MAG: hypothetical protein KMY54_09590 [Erysipelothrix sp.]|nr:hypothetical protein [Erysipelothrix sp.]
MSFKDEWFEIERALSSAVKREKNIDKGKTNWKVIEDSVMIGAIAIGCSLLEQLNRKNIDIHTKALFIVRNALVHNSGDVSKNHSKKDLGAIISYINNSDYKKLDKEINTPFLLIGNTIQLQDGVYSLIKHCLM